MANGQSSVTKIPLLLLVGPTAVGKSAIALKVAKHIDTDLISADSAQVYRYMDIGTAKPSPEEQNEVQHHLINLVNPDQSFSAADYQKAAFKTIKQVWKEGKLPFMVGGTGLYIRAVTERYAFGQKGASIDLRSSYQNIALTEGLDRLYEHLKSVDPASAAMIHPNDQRRIIRALEVYTLEGKPISGQVKETGRLESPYKIIWFGLKMERDLLYRNIENRVDKMIQQGFLDEVRNLYQLGYRENAPGMQALGYRQLLLYLSGELGWDETVAEIKKQTRNLAKRQLTWFRRDAHIEWITITDYVSINSIIENISLKVKDLTSAQANINFDRNRYERSQIDEGHD